MSWVFSFFFSLPVDLLECFRDLWVGLSVHFYRYSRCSCFVLRLKQTAFTEIPVDAHVNTYRDILWVCSSQLQEVCEEVSHIAVDIG